MRLLISAYACRPGMGSEPAVGWNWVSELCKKHELFVLTNYTNEPYINEFLANTSDELKRVNFIYVRPNKIFTIWYKEWSRGERLYYHLWQREALNVARKLHKREHFDLVQHLTYVTCIMPTYMYKLGIPFVYGPISGGEKIPDVIRYPMTRKEHLIELVRSITQLIPKLSINTHRAFKYASKIVTVTEDTIKLVPDKYHDKVVVMQAIGLKDEYFIPEPNFEKKSNDVVRVLIAGRMLSWKGFELGIEAFKLACSKGAKIELTVLGDGSESHIEKLHLLAGTLENQKIRFVRQVDYYKMREFYEQFDILLNCSLRDSGCLVVMEGMGRGLPVICVDTGGPRVNTNNDCAYKIAPQPFSVMKEQIAEALIELSTDTNKRKKMGLAAYRYANNKFKNSVKVQAFEQIYYEAVDGK